MIEAELMENRGVEVVHMDRVARHVEAEVVGRAVDVAGLHAAAGEPHREASVVMVAAVVAALHHRRAAKFSAPDHERVFQQSTLLEILHEGGAGAVGVAAVLLQIPREVAVLVPRLVE